MPNRSFACSRPSSPSPTTVITSVAASRIEPSAVTHDVLSCGDRKNTSNGYERCVSSTSAAHRSHSANSSDSELRAFALPIRYRSSGPDGGEPARASSRRTPTSRRLNAWYSTGR